VRPGMKVNPQEQGAPASPGTPKAGDEAKAG
jgi:hypothetical protein